MWQSVPFTEPENDGLGKGREGKVRRVKPGTLFLFEMSVRHPVQVEIIGLTFQFGS